ncbi:CPBP family intramembrane metalloprotease [Xanthomonadaceae bacterium JHOS43]|nr:CPBP family intramembrane metalloprotease [Xanthomonadaceae bacterium JHOS43]
MKSNMLAVGEKRKKFVVRTFVLPIVVLCVTSILGAIGMFTGPREYIYQTYHLVGGQSLAFGDIQSRVNALDVGDSRVHAISLTDQQLKKDNCEEDGVTLNVTFHAAALDPAVQEIHQEVLNKAYAAGLGPRCGGLSFKMDSLARVDGNSGLSVLLLSALALIILLFTWLSRRGRRPFWVNWADWQPRVGTMRALRLGTGYAMVALLVVTGLGAVAYLVGWVPEEPPFLPTLDDWPVFVLASFIAPIFEEFVYRAWLLERLSRVMRDSTALLISTCAFAAIHFPAALFEWLNLFLVGLVYGLLWLRTRSMIAVCVAHGLYNGLLLALQILLVG